MDPRIRMDSTGGTAKLAHPRRHDTGLAQSHGIGWADCGETVGGRLRTLSEGEYNEPHCDAAQQRGRGHRHCGAVRWGHFESAVRMVILVAVHGFT